MGFDFDSLKGNVYSLNVKEQYIAINIANSLMKLRIELHCTRKNGFKEISFVLSVAQCQNELTESLLISRMFRQREFKYFLVL